MGNLYFVMLNLKKKDVGSGHFLTVPVLNAPFIRIVHSGRPSRHEVLYTRSPFVPSILLFNHHLFLLHLEAETGHAGAVLVDCGFAVGGRVGGAGEEHALVALGLFLCADTARLLRVSSGPGGGVVAVVADGKLDCDEPIDFVLTLGFVAVSLVEMEGAGHDSAAVRRELLAWVSWYGALS